MLMNKFNLILLGGIALVWTVSYFAEALLRRGSSSLDPKTLDRVLRRTEGSDMLWRGPQFIGFALMLAAFLSNWRVVVITTRPFTVLAIGLAVYCVSNILHSWLVHRAYNGEAPNTPASRNALSAALMVSFAEAGLAVTIGWYVYSNAKVPNTKQPNAPATQNAASDKDSAPAKPQKLWGSENEALALLPGKEAWYFKALVKRESIRTRTEGGQTLYHLDDLEKTVEAGLPTVEDMKDYAAAGN